MANGATNSNYCKEKEKTEVIKLKTWNSKMMTDLMRRLGHYLKING